MSRTEAKKNISLLWNGKKKKKKDSDLNFQWKFFFVGSSTKTVLLALNCFKLRGHAFRVLGSRQGAASGWRLGMSYRSRHPEFDPCLSSIPIRSSLNYLILWRGFMFYQFEVCKGKIGSNSHHHRHWHVFLLLASLWKQKGTIINQFFDFYEQEKVLF